MPPAAPPRSAPPTAAPVAPRPAAPTPPPAPRAPAPASAFPQPQARPSATPAASRKGINPFLNNDPNQKGRRLARALVSDMIAYQPGKKEEGLANGTLKELFREEIKKSYEEYVDQIGKEFAESTTHFADALNDLLAGGQKMF